VCVLKDTLLMVGQLCTVNRDACNIKCPRTAVHTLFRFTVLENSSFNQGPPQREVDML
jgi:hypothetical protein